MKTNVPSDPTHAFDPRASMSDAERAETQYVRFPLVADQKRGRDGAGLAMGVVVALMLGGITLYSLSSQRTNKATPPEENTAPAQSAPPVKQAPTPAEPVPPKPAPDVVPPPPLPAPVDPQLAANATEAERNRAPALIMDSYVSTTTTSTVSGQAEQGGASTPKPMPGGLSNDETFAFRVGEAGIDRASATMLENPSKTITQGSLIAAVLETGINSDLPGYVRAFVSRDVRGFDNQHVLIPKGSRLIGQYKSGISAGQMRVFILWSRLIRPDGVSIMIGSPATDLAGETGLSGDVNTHFFKRYGAAILLSIIAGAATDSSNTIVLSSSQTAASIAAQNSANISPTIRVDQGQPIRIFTARDLDFSTVDTIEPTVGSR